MLNLTYEVTFTHEQVAKKVLNDTITNKLVKFKFARQELSSIKQEAIAITMRVGHPVQQPIDGDVELFVLFEDKPQQDRPLKFSMAVYNSIKQFMHVRAIISTISPELRDATCLHRSIQYLRLIRNKLDINPVKLFERVSSMKFQPEETVSGHPADFSCALSPQSAQIFEPDVEKAMDCQGCVQMHKPGKYRGTPRRSVQRRPPELWLSELDRYALLSRTIESELAGAKMPQ